MQQRAAILLAAVPPLLLSAQLVHGLYAPLSGSNRQWAVDAPALMMLEFFMMHARFISMFVMVGDRRRRIALAGCLGAIYLLFIAMFGFFFGTLTMVVNAGALLAGRLAGAALCGPSEARERISVSVFNVVLYLGVVAATAAPAAFPAFGFTPTVLQALGPALESASGLWAVQPYRAVAGAALYFIVLSLLELSRLRYVRSDTPGQAWTKIAGLDALIAPNAIELRQHGRPGLLLATMFGGIPLTFAIALLFDRSASGFNQALGLLMLLVGISVVIGMIRVSTRRTTILALRGVLVLRQSLLGTAPQERTFSPQDLHALDLDAMKAQDGTPVAWSIVLRIPHGKQGVAEQVQMVVGIDNEEQGRKLIELLKNRAGTPGAE